MLPFNTMPSLCHCGRGGDVFHFGSRKSPAGSPAGKAADCKASDTNCRLIAPGKSKGTDAAELGMVPCSSSMLSGCPSPSLSASSGLVSVSSPSGIPSPSVSRSSGLVPSVSSAESEMPSLSVSASVGFVPASISTKAVRPSPSRSDAASVGALSLRPKVSSYQRGRPSPSASCMPVGSWSSFR